MYEEKKIMYMSCYVHDDLIYTQPPLPKPRPRRGGGPPRSLQNRRKKGGKQRKPQHCSRNSNPYFRRWNAFPWPHPASPVIPVSIHREKIITPDTQQSSGC